MVAVIIKGVVGKERFLILDAKGGAATRQGGGLLGDLVHLWSSVCPGRIILNDCPFPGFYIFGQIKILFCGAII